MFGTNYTSVSGVTGCLSYCQGLGVGYAGVGEWFDLVGRFRCFGDGGGEKWEWIADMRIGAICFLIGVCLVQNTL